MIGATDLILAFGLDLCIGDPQWAPHPVRMIGSAVTGAEGFWRKFCSTPLGEKWGGVLLVLSIVLPAYLLTGLVVQAVDRISLHLSVVIGTVVLVFLIATTIATRELIQSAQLVITTIKEKDLEAARRHVSMIVGRDTRDLSEKRVLKATIETLAENLSDGIVAPLFYLALGGLPLAMAYKAVNTLDSMVGYKNERYQYFGWAAARLDDVANYVPARITGLLIVIAAFLASLVKDGAAAGAMARGSLSVMLRDGRKHPSPNSGVPEAAMAGALGIRLGGPSTYGGVLVEKPWIGDGGTDDYLAASQRAVTVAVVTSVMALALAALFLSLRSML
jgi:adenosylcobinamide-phosphate synthase